ncbi:hypothetical protein [Rosenbergiella metrosideri]|uniref:hypothetical protein n=1 Tax=Rosenbergiella metrosideri TaxID=2921185 RepID=UPI001F4F17C8|nr:hypothetical protein [Rosenbergiella metrosideri]
MNKSQIFNEIKDIYLRVMPAAISGSEDLMVDYDIDLDKLFLSDTEKLFAATEFLDKAKKSDDKAAVQAALVYIRVYSMRLSVFFENIKDDTDLLLKNIDWSDIPEDYQVPEHYNFQHE